ncbi:MAG: hypothetical protein ACYC26_01970 [Phycisphaerales bacterium]
MTYVHKISLAVLLASTGAMAQAPAAGPGVPVQSFADEYGVITRKNIFLRDRRSVVDTENHAVTQPVPPTPVEKTYVLVGVAVGDQDSRAYFEHSGMVEKHAAGEAIGPGTLRGIQVDGVIYESQGRRTAVKVGQDLSGAIASPPPPPPPPEVKPTGVKPLEAAPAAGASGQPASVSPGAGAVPGAGLSVEERMRRRRQESLGH